MVPPPATTDQVGVIATTLPLASRPTAVNCWLVLMASDAGFGVTVMVASGPGVTMTVAEPVLPLAVAVTVLLNVPGVVPAVNRPEALMVPPPAVTDQVGVTATTAPEKSVPTAVNCRVPPTARVVGLGETTRLTSDPGPLMPCTSHDDVNAPASATATITRAMRARGASARTMRLFMTLLIEVLLT